MSPRKRRKSEAPLEAENEDATSVVVEGQDRLSKEVEVWDAFREEHIEGALSLVQPSKRSILITLRNMW